MSALQLVHSCSRNVPSAPDVQKEFGLDGDWWQRTA